MTELSVDFLKRLQAANGGTVEDARQVVLDALGRYRSDVWPSPLRLPISLPTWPRIAPPKIHGAEFIIDGDTVRTV